MNAAYHRQFFSDIRFTTLVTLGLFAGGFGIGGRLFLAIPVVARLGACLTVAKRRLRSVLDEAFRPDRADVTSA